MSAISTRISMNNTRSELETEISRALIHFEKEFMGRGPLETKTYVLDDIIMVRLKGVLTPAERKLSQSPTHRSQYLLKQVRNELLTTGRPMLEAIVSDIANAEVQSVHTDISTKTGERIIVFTLKQKLDLVCARPERHESRERLDQASEETPVDRDSLAAART